MINEAPKSHLRPFLIFNGVLLLHLIFLAVFFIQLADTPAGRKLIEKLAHHKILQTLAKNTKKLSQPKLEKSKVDQDKHALEAANKVKPIANEELYFISHIVDMSDNISNNISDDQTKNHTAQEPPKKNNTLTNISVPTVEVVKPETKTVIVQNYSNRELAQLQKDLETKADLLEQQTELNAQKYKINQTELKKIKFNLNINHQELKTPASSDRELIELPDLDHNNQVNNNINIGDHSNGLGSKPIIRALAPSAYLRFANSNGQNIMSQAGRKSGQPTIQDLRKLSYNAMVMRTFSDAFNAFKLIFNMFINEHTVIYVRFIIDPTGQVVHIDTHSDNAPPNVLEFIRKAIAYANPFPPLPKHLAKDNYIFGPFAITFNPGRVAGQYVWTQSKAVN